MFNEFADGTCPSYGVARKTSLKKSERADSVGDRRQVDAREICYNKIS